MKISEVVYTLNKIIAEHGDLELVVTSGDGDERMPVTDVGISEALGGGDLAAYVSTGG